jgi:small-conductance mechanosensitive channel
MEMTVAMTKSRFGLHTLVAGLEPSEATMPAWMPAWGERLWELAASYPWLLALATVTIAWLLAKLAELILIHGIGRLARRTHTDLDDEVLARLRRPVGLTILVIGLSLAITSLDLPVRLATTSIRLLQTILVLSWLLALSPVARLVLGAIARHHHRIPWIEERTLPLLDIASKLIFFGGGSYALFLVWGINPAPWLASAGVIGIAVGFAAKDTLANLFSGFFIIADAPYKIGDYITLDTGERGTVTHVGIRSTRLLTRDDVEVTLPNAVIGNAKIVNESGGRWERERIRVPVGVAYDSDVDRVMEVLLSIARDTPEVVQDPPAVVRLRRLGESSLDFELLCWIEKPELRGRITHELLLAVVRRFRADSISIPFPQRDLWIRASPGDSGMDAAKSK